MTELGWMLVVLVGVVLAYDVARRLTTGLTEQQMRAIEADRKREFDEQRRIWIVSLSEVNDSRIKLEQRLAEHIKLFEEICLQWRAKVGELEAKCDRVVVDARNEIAGDLATVSDITRKGWR